MNDVISYRSHLLNEEYYKINVLGEFGDYSSGLVVKGFGEENKLKLKSWKRKTRRF